MTGFVYLNGAIVPAAEAKISPFDRGFLFGDGLFETMRIYDRIPYLLDRHLDRLQTSAAEIFLNLPDSRELADAVKETIAANDLSEGVVRLTVSRGETTDIRTDPAARPTIFINVRALPPALGSEASNHLVTLATPHVRPATNIAVKSLSYMPSVLGMIELARRGAVEGVMLTPEGFVAEGAVSNVFCVIDGDLWTPPLELGILPGITRARVLELAADLGIETHETSFDLDRLRSASECFYTSSVREVVPVRTLDSVPVGGGEAGEITRKIAELYRRDVARHR